MMRVLPGGWPDLHGFGGFGEGIQGGSDEHDEHTRGNRGKSIQTHTHTRLPVTPAGPNHPPKSNQTTRKTQMVESCGEIK